MTPTWLIEYQREINTAIEKYFVLRYKGSLGIELTFEEALRYAVEGGGKRIRPILALVAYEFFATKNNTYTLKDRETFVQGIIGLEFIHCFTLVHDDLPCMDNDELRRGKPTVWKAYGETLAVLVGDCLQTMGFESLSILEDVRVIREVARAIGDLGVARGQVRDTLLMQKDLTLEDILRLHDEKTGVFIAISLVIGALIGGAGEEDIQKIRKFGFLLGRAFQIQDDILDYEGDAQILGKKTGKDVELGKGIVASIGIERAKILLTEIENEGIQLLDFFQYEKFFDIQNFIIKRVS